MADFPLPISNKRAVLKKGVLGVLKDYAIEHMVTVTEGEITKSLKDAKDKNGKKEGEEKLFLHAGFAPVSSVKTTSKGPITQYNIHVLGINRSGILETWILQVSNEMAMKSWVQRIREAARPLPDGKSQCDNCQTKLKWFNLRRPHCKLCGSTLCSECTSPPIRLDSLGYRSLERVCPSCYLYLDKPPATRAYLQGEKVIAHGRYAGVVVKAPREKESMCTVRIAYKQVAKGKKREEERLFRGVSLFPYTRRTYAAYRINNFLRARIGYFKTAEKMLWSVWNSLDNTFEHVHLLVDAKLSKSRKLLERQKEMMNLNQPKEKELVSLPSASSESVESSYRGAHIMWPITLEVIKQMIAAFQTQMPLHSLYVKQILSLTLKTFGKEPTLVPITIKEGCTLTLVGDLHGQYADLLKIFELQGFPSPTNWYLFNGDFVDRGQQGVEVILTLYAFKLLYPEYVFLNRGNHESRMQNSLMGFEEQVLQMYDVSFTRDQNAGRAIFERFQATFDRLPLCAVVNERVFVVHGGLCEDTTVTLADIAAVDRVREPPVYSKKREDIIMTELLWSDPKQSMTGTFPSTRGAGVFWGPDITLKFLELNQLELVIRSHECVKEGYETMHDAKVVTLFSASKYCGTQTNKGGILTFDHKLGLTPQNYVASEICKLSLKRESKKIENDIVDMLVELVMPKKVDLYHAFTSKDVDRSGFIRSLDFANVLRTVLQLDIPILWFLNAITEVKITEGRKYVDYRSFLERYKVSSSNLSSEWAGSIINTVSRRIFKEIDSGSMQKAFSQLDTDGNGEIDLLEFTQILKELKIELTDGQLHELMLYLDTNGDGRIDYEEFSAKFRVVFRKTTEGEDGGLDVREVRPSLLQPHFEDRNTAEAAYRQLTEIGRRIYSKFGADLDKAFHFFDVNNDGKLTVEECGVAFQKLGTEMTAEEVNNIFHVLDKDDNGAVDVGEFVGSFHVSVEGERDWSSSIVQDIFKVLYHHRRHIKGLLQHLDQQGTGTVSVPQFQEALTAMNDDLGHPLTSDQISVLIEHMNEKKMGLISYKEFLSNFYITDLGSGRSGSWRSDSVKNGGS